MRAILLVAALMAAVTAAQAITPLACTEDCNIEATEKGYLPPAAEIASGASVTWTSPDITHVQVERGAGVMDSCFVTIADGNGDPTEPHEFTLQDGKVYATHWDDDNSQFVTKECTTAWVDALGLTGTIPYICAIHFGMSGFIVVTSQ